MNNNDEKRLVLIGIRRKGEKGFTKSFDTRVNLKNDPSKKEKVNTTIDPAQISDSSQIIRIMPS